MTETAIFEALKWVALVALSGFTYMLRRELDAQDKVNESLKKDIQELKDTRVHKDDFRELKVELRSWFDDLKQDIRTIRNEKS